MSDTSDQLRREAAKPQSVSIPGLSVGRHNLRDQIELDKYLTKKEASANRSLPIRIGKIRPPGAV